MATSYEENVDKTKITPELLNRYNRLVSQGTPVDKIVRKLRLKKVDGLIVYPQNIIENNTQDDYAQDVGKFIVESILPKMGTKTQQAISSGRQNIVADIDSNILTALFETSSAKDKGIPLRGGGKLGVNELTSSDFTTNMIDSEKLKLGKNLKSGYKRNFDVNKARGQFNLLKANLDNVTKRNIDSLLKYLKGKYDNVEDEKDVVFKFIDIPTEEMFSNKMMSDLSQREATYNYWEKIYDAFDKKDDPNGFMKKIEKLTDMLTLEVDVDQDKLSGEQKLFLDDAKNFVDRMKKIEDLNYVVEVKVADVGIEDAEERAFLFIERFFKNHHGISDAFDQQNVEITYENVVTEDGTSKDMSSINVEATDSPDVDEVDIEAFDKVTLDPLAIKYLKEDLEGLAEFYSDYENSMLKQLREQFADYQVFLARPEDYRAVLQGVEDALESIEKVAKDTVHLPIFLFNTPTLSKITEYKKEASNANKIQEDIFDFLDAYRDLLEDDKTFAAVNVDLVLQGRGRGTLSDPTPLERYKQTQPTRVGSVRKLAKELKKLVDEINNDILELFVKPMHSIHRFGMSLPFEKSVQLRSIVSASDNVGEEFLAYKEIGERLKNFDNTFIGQSQAEKMLKFLQDVTRGEIFTDATATQSGARAFVNSIMVAFNNNKKVKKQLQEEVSSIYGALLSVSKEKQNIPNVYEGINIRDAYVENRIDDPNEIQALQVLTNAIRERQNTLRESNDGPIRDSTLDSLLSELDRVAKSDIYSKLLQAHDSLRILKGKMLHYGKRDETNFDHVEDMLIKMQDEYDLDMSAGELVSIVNDIDSFSSISKNYGISQEHVYLIKANFR